MIDALGDEYRGTPIEYTTQTERLGLAHAVAEAEPYVDGPILLCNGDNVLGDDLRSLAAAHEGAATLLFEETDPGARETNGDRRHGRRLRRPRCRETRQPTEHPRERRCFRLLVFGFRGLSGRRAV